MFGLENTTPILHENKKGCGFAAVYLIEALQCPYKINANDPRPEKSNNTADMDCFASMMLAMTFPQFVEIRPKEPLWAVR